MKYSFKAIQQPDPPPFETLAHAGGGNHTQGNGRIGTAAPVEAASPQLTRPTRAGLPSYSAPARPNPSEPAQGSLLSAAPSVNFSISVPASNYRTLRDTDNRYWINGYQWIDFGGSARNDNIWGGTGNDTLYGRVAANQHLWKLAA